MGSIVEKRSYRSEPVGGAKASYDCSLRLHVCCIQLERERMTERVDTRGGSFHGEEPGKKSRSERWGDSLSLTQVWSVRGDQGEVSLGYFSLIERAGRGELWRKRSSPLQEGGKIVGVLGRGDLLSE